MTSEDPIVLELAPLPREQVGPFLLLGLDKDATPEQIEAHWAQRVIWARKNQIGISLQDINWARELITDPGKRVQADVVSLNPDTMDGIVKTLGKKVGDLAGPTWRPLDVEKTLVDQIPKITLPKIREFYQSVILPDPPKEVPGVEMVLLEHVSLPLDPWDCFLPPETRVEI